MINTNATVTTAGCAKPKNASAEGITPSTTRTTKAPMEIASYLNFPQIKNPKRVTRVRESIS